MKAVDFFNRNDYDYLVNDYDYLVKGSYTD